VRIETLTAASLDEARRLLMAALPFDRVDVVADEKLFGDNGARLGEALGAWEAGRLVGVAATAGRWVKLIAVEASARRRGIGRALVETARRPRLRIGDHPGNYLSPGVDERYEDARAFFAGLGFREVGEVENLRAPLDGNPLVSELRAAELAARVRAAGYAVRRAEAADRRRLLDWVAVTFAPVWANEVARALDGPRRAVHVALHKNEPVAFAAADGNNRGLGWFGPAGTAAEHRGRGLGEALLIACLVDVRGLPEGGVIAWIGPKPFYAHACGAVEDRRFVQLELA
jgi:GNAT superfamily N-acetyltransferase